MKLGANQNLFNIYVFGGLSAYALSTICYLLILSKMNLSLAYPVVIGLTIATTTFVGAILFREKVTPHHWLGIGLMLSGIATLTR
jgi:small multidrug resistance pump